MLFYFKTFLNNDLWFTYPLNSTINKNLRKLISKAQELNGVVINEGCAYNFKNEEDILNFNLFIAQLLLNNTRFPTENK